MEDKIIAVGELLNESQGRLEAFQDDGEIEGLLEHVPGMFDALSLVLSRIEDDPRDVSSGELAEGILDDLIYGLTGR